jgi:hypothetical protein
MQPLHYVAVTRVMGPIDERELQHRLELHHARQHEHREARRARRRRILRPLRAAFPKRAARHVALAPR